MPARAPQTRRLSSSSASGKREAQARPPANYGDRITVTLHLIEATFSSSAPPSIVRRAIRRELRIWLFSVSCVARRLAQQAERRRPAPSAARATVRSWRGHPPPQSHNRTRTFWHPARAAIWRAEPPLHTFSNFPLPHRSFRRIIPIRNDVPA